MADYRKLFTKSFSLPNIHLLQGLALQYILYSDLSSSVKIKVKGQQKHIVHKCSPQRSTFEHIEDLKGEMH